ncbi:MAG: hypothetical protein V9E94_00735 [Microthrixaceae bacterium]
MTTTGRRDHTTVLVLACASAVAVLIANISGIATGDDGVGYRAIADSLLAGDGYGYFLEDPVTIWPPVWPALMALVALLTPLDTMGAAIALNAAVAVGVVLTGNHLLRMVLDDRRLVMAGTFVLALGPATVGLGHVLMTDMAFALVTLWWMAALMRFRRSGSVAVLLAASLLVWLGFGLRYVGLVLIPVGGLWLLIGPKRGWQGRVRDVAVYAVAASVVPIGWMMRNHAMDGTFTGERNPSARGLIDNAMDVAATLGRFLLPGPGNGLVKIWAVVGIVVFAAAAVVTWRVLRSTPGPVLARLWSFAARPLGLVLLFAGSYLLYMLYVRTTTALNQLDTRLLFPAYLPLVVCALALLDRVGRPGVLIARIWAVANVTVGLIGMVAFAAGHPYFVGNYESDVFAVVRGNEAIAALPADCRLYSNLPNALYPSYESLWSPRRTALESTRRIGDLERITATLDATPSCLVWIDEPPTYGHLYTLEQLHERLELEPVSSEGDVSTYLMHARSN